MGARPTLVERQQKPDFRCSAPGPVKDTKGLSIDFLVPPSVPRLRFNSRNMRTKFLVESHPRSKVRFEVAQSRSIIKINIQFVLSFVRGPVKDISDRPGKKYADQNL